MKKVLLATMFGLVCSTPASAVVTEEYLFNVDTTLLSVQTYTIPSDVIATWFAKPKCGVYANLQFASSVPAEKNRYWNTMLAARLAKKNMSFSYHWDNVANTCIISSYWVNEG